MVTDTKIEEMTTCLQNTPLSSFEVINGELRKLMTTLFLNNRPKQPIDLVLEQTINYNKSYYVLKLMPSSYKKSSKRLIYS